MSANQRDPLETNNASEPFNSQYYMGLFLVVISLGIFMVPRYRMRQGFKSDLQLLIKTLETLEFDWIENIHFETPISTDQSKSYS